MSVLIALFYLHVYMICLIQVQPCMSHLFISNFKWVSINIILWAHNFYLWEFCYFNLLHWTDCPKSVLFLLVCSVMSSSVLTSMVLAVVCPYATLLHWYQYFIIPMLGIVIFSANIIVPTIIIFYIVLFLSYDLLSVWEKGQAVYTCASPHSSLPFCLRCQDSFLHHFPSSQRIVFGRSARVDVLAPCSFIWASLFYLELLWFMNDISLHSILLTFVASDEKSGDTWCGVSYMEYLLLLFTCCEDYPPLFSSVFQCLMLYFWVRLLEWHCGSHLASSICMFVFHHIWKYL